MSRIRILAYIMVLCCLIVLAGAPFCFASAVDAANAGMEANKNGDKEKAKILFQSALKSNELSKENYIVVNNQLCEIFWSEAEKGQAIDCYSETLYLSPDNPVARLSRGTLYHHTGKYEKAIEDLTRYIALVPRNHMGYIYRGESYLALKKHDRAISDLSQAVRLRSGHGDMYIHRGNTYLKTGNYNLALADFKKAIKIDPKNSYAYQAMAWAYAACPNRDYRDGAKAVEFAKKALKLENTDTPDPVFLTTLAAAYAESGMFQKAVDTQKQAMAKVTGTAGFDISKEELVRRLKLYKNGEPYSTE